MMRSCLVLILLLAGIAALSAQNMQRNIPRQPKAKKPAPTEVAVVQYDTVVPAEGEIVVAGFEKPLRDNRETMFVTNNRSHEICALTLQIDYLDSKQRQLHQAEHCIWVDIPSGETRRVEIKSFDRSKLFYYHKTALTGRPKQATPFWVEVKVVNVICLKSSEQ